MVNTPRTPTFIFTNSNGLELDSFDTFKISWRNLAVVARYGPIEPCFLQCCMHTSLHGENMNFFFEQHLIHCCMADLVKVKIPSANWYGYHNNLRMFQGKNYNYNLFRETCFRKKITPRYYAALLHSIQDRSINTT